MKDNFQITNILYILKAINLAIQFHYKNYLLLFLKILYSLKWLTEKSPSFPIYCYDLLFYPLLSL